jgi:Zinc carboxypeptidase
MTIFDATLHKPFAIAILGMASLPFAIMRAEATSDGAVTVRADFPGGNVAVLHNDGSTLHVAPDLRGDSPWFYWCFEAQASQPGRVTFVFPEKVAGFKHGAIGFQGPAISSDGGLTWKWMGADHVDGSSFFFDFAKANEPVRFAVTIPYVQRELDAFLAKHSGNPHLTASVLTKSRHGRDVELLQIGEPGPNVQTVLVTARHHAAETIASYVLEGFLEEAMSANPAGAEFRKRYVLFAVPLVDKDGVEEGDQGKNRKPHDHNRDYGETSLYPEIQAIKALDRQNNFQLTLDFHCPTLVMEDHQVMYFVGAKEHPRYNFENVSELAGWIKKGLPDSAPHGPLVWLKTAAEPTPMNSHYFGFKHGAIMAATLEIPFAPPGKATDPAACRQYGRAILQAWVNTHFRAPGRDDN